MKTKIALMTIIAGTTMMSCQKEALFMDILPKEQQQDTREASVRKPQRITNGIAETSYHYDSYGRLESVSNGSIIQKKFEYDREGRLARLLLFDAKETISYFYGDDRFTVRAVRSRILSSDEADRIGEITLVFDQHGRKIAETEIIHATEQVIKTSYVYDDNDRLLSFDRLANGELELSLRTEGFQPGFSHLAVLDILAWEPGSALQKGLPRYQSVECLKGRSETYFTYRTNSALQPDLVFATIDRQSTIESSVTYH